MACLFSVKSAYKVCVDDFKRSKTRNGGSSSLSASNNSVNTWKQLWKLNCPKKMLHFLWRLAHNSLALRVNLKRRGMKIDSKCCLCNRLDEDGAHLFFKCKQVSLLWYMMQMENIRAHFASMQSAVEGT